jgi:hypothetical protein
MKPINSIKLTAAAIILSGVAAWAGGAPEDRMPPDTSSRQVVGGLSNYNENIHASAERTPNRVLSNYNENIHASAERAPNRVPSDRNSAQIIGGPSHYSENIHAGAERIPVRGK